MITFEKMHGLGNDFILLQDITSDQYDLSRLSKRLCDRHFGIGADGIILVLPSITSDIRMRIINSDGSEPDMCGNGVRCFAKYVYDNKLLNKDKFTVETYAGVIVPELIIENDNVVLIKVNMGTPEINRQKIPMKSESENVINEPLTIGNNTFFITSMLMSVPHTIVYVDNLEVIDIENIGKQIEKHELFPQGTNVNFVQVLNHNEIIVRTWERGAGATLACGTGSCASVVASILNKKTERKVVVHLEAGDLDIEWKEDNNVFMAGPAKSVFNGKIDI